MYALFENGKFKEFVSEIAAWTYQADRKYMLYKIDMNQIRNDTGIDEYKCILDKDNIPVLIPKNWHSHSEFIKIQANAVEDITKIEDLYKNRFVKIETSIQNMPFIKRLKYLFTRKLEV